MITMWRTIATACRKISPDETKNLTKSVDNGLLKTYRVKVEVPNSLNYHLLLYVCRL